MKYAILKNNEKYSKQEYKKEKELTILFDKNYHNIISEKSFFIKIEKQFKSKKFKNFKHSIADGFLLVWDNPTTPTLYITEIELERHGLKHIIPQIGDFISFIQSSTIEELDVIKKYLYEEIRKDKALFKKIQKESEKEVYELLNNSIEDLQILLVIDKISPELSIGLSHIEKAINVKIRKIEPSLFLKEHEEVILFSDSEIADEETKDLTGQLKLEEYTLEYHLGNKPEIIPLIFNSFLNHVKLKKIKESPTKHYIGFFKEKKMIFSCVVRRNSLVFYSKAKVNEIKKNMFGTLQFRDVRKTGHYTNHLPTEIIIVGLEQVDDLIKYFNEVYKRY